MAVFALGDSQIVSMEILSKRKSGLDVQGFYTSRIRYFFNRARERLWVKPLAVCLLSIVAAFSAKVADRVHLGEVVPAITVESIETLLSIMAASMLVIATFAVASMVSAYASAGSAATPRTFSLVIADDVSQNALSTFIGAFIFSIVALTAVKNSVFDPAGRFALFALTAIVFGWVIFTFVRWVDRIARLGRLGATVDKVEKAAAAALKQRRDAPTLNGLAISAREPHGTPVFSATVGYVQRIDIAALQACAQQVKGRVVVVALPGVFAVPNRVLAYVSGDKEKESELDLEKVSRAFQIGEDRRFDDDPRFGLIVLSEIAGRALSPAVNDPGTAIDIIGTLVRLFVLWAERPETANSSVKYDHVEVPEILIRDMFDDAFTSIARDGAGSVEVAVRLQKALGTLASIGDVAMREAACIHARLSLARAERSLQLPEELAVVRNAAAFAEEADSRS